MVVKMSKMAQKCMIDRLTKKIKVHSIETYLKETVPIVSYESNRGVNGLLSISFHLDEEAKLANTSPLLLENVYIQAKDKVALINCYIRESLIEGTEDTKSFSSLLNRNHFERCVFININFDDMWWDCIFTHCAFINCSLNGSYFCNNNKIEEQIGFDESTYDENKKILIEYYPMVCPAEGSFIAWKKVRSVETSDIGPFPYLVKLLIPEDAQRTSSFSHKCRASKAVVLDIVNPNTMKSERVDVCSIADSDFTYRVGETVEPTQPFESDRFIECTSGIHFFINKYEALHY